MFYFRIISLSFIFIGIIFVLILIFLSRKNKNLPKKINSDYNFCILIPARYESKVIEGLLKSIKNQTHKIPMSDVYVIIESKNDPTYDISKKYGASVFIRKKLNLQRKGYALDEAVKDILLHNKHYDAYFIFDADNILDKNYIKNMIPIYDKGYDLASGYRNCKNGNDSVVSASSALTFSLVNTIFNEQKNKKNRNITFSGTGFYIRGYLLEKWGGYPFHTLTEDYELSCYATLNNLTTFYNTKSIFYDEQPVRFKDTLNQRIRWIKGYFDVRKKYEKEIYKSLKISNYNKGSKIDEAFGIKPYIFMVIGLVLWLLSLVFFILYNLFLKNIVWKKYFMEFLTLFLLIYFALFVMTFVILLLEGNKINLKLKSKIKVLFYNPIFMLSYVPCAIKALTSKNVTWKRVEHGNSK